MILLLLLETSDVCGYCGPVYFLETIYFSQTGLDLECSVPVSILDQIGGEMYGMGCKLVISSFARLF